jgi:carboxyl-terminal processing protease
MGSLCLLSVTLLFAAAPNETPDADADAFATLLRKVHPVIQENSILRPSQRRLAELALRGLYKGQGEDLPENLARRLKNEKATPAELHAVLCDGYRQLAERCELDVDLAVKEAMAFTLNTFDPHADFRPHPGFRYEWVQRFGIGIELRLDPKTQEPCVVTTLKDSPAYRAGIRAGDRITHIFHPQQPGLNNEDATEAMTTANIGLEKVVQRLLGPKDSKVSLLICREGVEKPIPFTVVRGSVVFENVVGWRRKKDDSWDYLVDRERKVSYLRVKVFDWDTRKQLEQVLDEMETQGVRGVVLDLRFCPGGLISAAKQAAEQFVEDGDYVSIESATRKAVKFQIENGRRRRALAVACLINRETSSAAEMLAAALQDHHRAVVVGERSQGKASVQLLPDLIDYYELKLTGCVFLRPNGKKLDRIALPGQDADEWGVTPDAGNIIQLTAKETEALKEQLERRAIIPNRDLPRKREPALEDRQLQRALEILAKSISNK